MKIKQSILVSLVLVSLSGCTTGSKTRINYYQTTTISETSKPQPETPQKVYIEKPVPVYIEKEVPVYIKPTETPTFINLTGEIKNKVKRKIIAAYETL